MKRPMALGLALVLAACGSRGDLRPVEGQALPPAPYGAQATPTPGQLLEPTPETRPNRDDGVLDGSREREADPFDLPPPGAR